MPHPETAKSEPQPKARNASWAPDSAEPATGTTPSLKYFGSFFRAAAKVVPNPVAIDIPVTAVKKARAFTEREIEKRSYLYYVGIL